jgi:sporulation protein YlmC with PRC-barrel domain
VTIAELLEHRVVDADGREVGRVHDVRADDSDGQLRVTGLVTGPGAFAYRLGYATGRVRGPWLLTRMAAWLQTEVLVVDWEQVERVEEGRVHLRTTRDRLTRVYGEERP